MKPLFEHIDVAGVDLEVLRTGSGTPLLYLHDGGGLEASLPLIEILSQRYEIHAPSHPGFGGSQLLAGINTVDDVAYVYLDYLEQQNLKDVYLVGASFGAWIACEIAVKTTVRLRALALIDALGVKFGSRDKHDVADIFYLLPEEARELCYHTPRGPLQVPDMEAARRIARNRESLSLFGWSPLLHNPKLRGRLHRIRIPTLVLWGASDRIAPIDYGKSYCAAIAGAEFALLEKAGHLPHVERPQVTAEALEKFLARAALTV